MLDSGSELLRPSLHWLSDLGETGKVSDVLKTADLMQELIRQTNDIQSEAEKADPDVLLERLAKRKSLLDTLETNHALIQPVIEQCTHNNEIKRVFSDLATRIKQSDKEMVTSIQKRKQDIMSQLQEIHNQTNIQRYMR